MGVGSLKVLDLFAGVGGWSNCWREAGHEVFSIDIDHAFDVDLHADILEVHANDLPWRPDVILASPPCETFSVASIGTHWGGGHRGYVPKTDAARNGIALLEKTRTLILSLVPHHSVMENPRGVMRKVFALPDHTVWYCHYGDDRAKPTDLWTTGMGHWIPRPQCHNRRPSHPDWCCCHDHQAASRGAKTGTQGRATYAHRSEIPEELAREVMSLLTEETEG